MSDEKPQAASEGGIGQSASTAGLAGIKHGTEVEVIEFGRKRIAWPVYGGWRTMRRGVVCWCWPEALMPANEELTGAKRPG